MTTEPSSAAGNAAQDAADRRRSGRLTDVSPALVPLLRARELDRLDLPEPPAASPDGERVKDDLRAAKGIALAAGVSGVFWGGCAFLIY